MVYRSRLFIGIVHLRSVQRGDVYFYFLYTFHQLPVPVTSINGSAAATWVVSRSFSVGCDR